VGADRASYYCKEGAQLSPEHLNLIVGSAIAPEVARSRGYRTITTKAELARYGFGKNQQITPTLLIPLYDVTGKFAGYYQHRPDSLRVKDGKPIKYETLAKMRMVLDIHPFLSRKRVKSTDEAGLDVMEPPLIADPSIPLLITEGVRKADAAVSIGLCCVALLGVWNWRGTNEAGGRVALADWESVALNGRKVYIVFDSDVMEKRAVNLALVRLKSFLEARKAIVRLVYLRAGHYGEKVGLDDYIFVRKQARSTDAEIVDGLLALATDELRSLPDRDDGEEDCASVGPYRETPRGLSRIRFSNDIEVDIPLTNFSARIVAEVSRDDGAEKTRTFEIEATLKGSPSKFTISAASFSGMRWPVEQIGSGAVVYAGVGTADHTRTAIQLLSQNTKTRTVYAHSGWRKIDGSWVYLHSGGALGANGAVEGVEVELPPELAAFKLEIANDPMPAVRASMRMLDLGPDHLTVPVYGAILRAIIGGADFSIFEYGRTGSFKTELAALVQQHFGAEFTARNLPASFTSTGNSNEMLTFIAKDAVLVIDEFHPPASGTERDQMHRDAARILRAQGNRSGRTRLRADGSLKPTKPPRGLIVATGEEQPRGQSLQARMLTLEVQKGDIDAKRLTACQVDAAAGLYAQATAAFIRWLAPRFDDVQRDFREMVVTLRTTLAHGHARTNDIRAQLTASYSTFVNFLVQTEVINEFEATKLQCRIGAGLQGAAKAQAQFSDNADPCQRFAQLLGSAIASGEAHLADRSGDPPRDREGVCGWRERIIGTGQYERTEWQPQGSRIGWIENDDLYLEPIAS
jgi:hypothetical protein